MGCSWVMKDRFVIWTINLKLIIKNNLFSVCFVHVLTAWNTYPQEYMLIWKFPIYYANECLFHISMICPILNKIVWAYETVDKNNIVPSISFETMKGTTFIFISSNFIWHIITSSAPVLFGFKHLLPPRPHGSKGLLNLNKHI